MMAGDRLFVHPSNMKLIGKSKIFEVPHPEVFGVDKCYIGFAGNAGAFGTIISWLSTPEEKQPRFSGVEMLLLTNNGEILHGTTLRNFMHITEPHYAIGSGMMYAQAAMSAGKTPFEAVKIAAKHDIYTGGPFNKLDM